MVQVLQTISLCLGIASSTFALLFLLSDKFRGIFLRSKKQKEQEKEAEAEQKETDKCLLRDAILTNYRMHKDVKEWTSDDYENFEHLYNQYKKLGGNSFVDKLWKNVQTWKIIW